MSTIDVVVRARWAEAEGVVSVVLARPDGGDLPEWSPGAHIDVVLPEHTRQYSLCGSPLRRDEYRIAVLLEQAGRGGSRSVHALQEGDAVGIHLPRNNFPLDDAKSYLFIAGGIGITPLLPMIEEVASRQGNWKLVYGGRSRGSMAFVDALAQREGVVEIHPEDEFGRLDITGLMEYATTTDSAVYSCGPTGLLDALEISAAAHGVELHVERFAAVVASDAVNTPFEVVCAESGITVAVRDDQSMLDALVNAGIDMNFKCREGTCGSCELSVLGGLPDHRDAIIAKADRATSEVIFPCVSRSLDRQLILDI
uniref:2-hydroxypyridine dioxygenase reductase n=1 Tax=Rhodococcus sp. PY11 TaxID=551544 RepID=B5MAD7_9NOCA|nr:2-hydroxypyridine dioxygenase reductase [Rhodococcus sp. PY11]